MYGSLTKSTSEWNITVSSIGTYNFTGMLTHLNQELTNNTISNTSYDIAGYIDDFRIYDKALTAQEISDIYNDTEPLVGGSSSSTTSGTIDTTNMLVWYKFDDALILV